MKRKIALLSIIVMISVLLTGCNFTISTAERTTEKLTDKPIDKNSIVAEIYSEVYEQIKAELYDQIYQEIRKEYLNGTVDIDDIQNRIYKVVRESGKGNIGVTSYKYETDGTSSSYKTGSGIIYDTEKVTVDEVEYNKYYVVTNQHIFEGSDTGKVYFEDGTTLNAEIIGTDSTTDIAVLSFLTENTYHVNQLGNSDEIGVGEIVLAIGNPKGSSLYGSVTLGIVSGKNRNLIENGATNTINEFIQHDAAINSGNSGGGLYTLDGICIGINSQKYVSSDIEGLNFAIPSNLVLKVAAEIRQYGSYSGSVSLGITVTGVDALTESGREKYNVPADVTKGIVIISVNEGTTATGIVESGDIMVKFGDASIESSDDLKNALKNYKIGDTVNATIIRNGEEKEVSFTFKRAE